MRRTQPITVIAVVALMGFSFLPSPADSDGTGEHGATRASTAATTAPNIVLILTDDQRYDELVGMPVVRGLLGRHGMRFRRAFVVNALCCPSRAATLTGTYSHTNGVYLNDGTEGGFRGFDDRSTLPVWLRDAGYQTALVGKYLNNYYEADYVPPGWTRWAALVGENAVYHDYDLSLDGRKVHHGSATDDYATDVFAGLAGSFIRHADRERPLFLYFSPPAPHGPNTPAIRDESARVPSHGTGPAFDERHMRDKIRWMRELPRLTAAQRRSVQNRWIARARSLLAVDRAVRRIVSALRDTGRLRNTLFVFTSDNGYSMGEHRLLSKMNPYEESIRVPMIVRWDGHVPAGTTSDALVANIDLAPTFAAAAGASAPGVEGESLLPMFAGDGPVRSALLIEHQTFGPRGGDPHDPPTYCAIRTQHWKLVRYQRGMELYDLQADPWELRSLDGRSSVAEVQRRLLGRLRGMCSPRPPGLGPF